MYFTIKTQLAVMSFYTHHCRGRALVSLAIRAYGRNIVLNWTQVQFERMMWLALVLYMMS